MRALILFLVSIHAGGKYLPLVTKAFELYDEYAAVTAPMAGGKAMAEKDLRAAAEKQWMDRASNPNAGGGG